MTTFSGGLRGSGDALASLNLTINLPSSVGAYIGDPVNAVLGDEVIGGSFVVNLPASRPPTLNYDGVVQFAFFDDFYNRVWFIPSTVDFGPITSATSKNVMMWNANLHTVTLESIDLPLDDSLSYGGLTLPLVIKALAARTVSIGVAADGDIEVSGTFTFHFDDDSVGFIPVSGVRSRVWAFSPSWASGVEVSIEYLTEVITSRIGKEQRIAGREEPRMEITFTSFANDYNFRKFLRQMTSWQNKTTLMPDFSHSIYLAETALEGDDVITFDSVDDWMVPDRVLIFMNANPSSSEFIVRKVESVVGNVVTLTASIDRDWPKGTKVYPAYTGRLGTQIGATQHTNRLIEANITFKAEPGFELWSNAGDAPLTYLGRELFLTKPDWSQSISPEFQAVMETIDYGIGRTTHTLPQEFGDRYHKATYTEMNRQSADDIVRMFRRQLGMQGEFFMPTFVEDLRLKLPAPIGTIGLRVEGVDTYKDYGTSTVYKNLIIFLKDGTYELCNVNDILLISDTDGDDSIISLTDALSRTVNPVDVMQICWLPLWRFVSDGLVAKWLTDEVAQIDLNMKTLEFVEAES